MLNKKIIALLITSLVSANIVFADFMDEASMYTGEMFFTNPSISKEEAGPVTVNKKVTLPPLKKARYLVKQKVRKHNAKKRQLAPTSDGTDVFDAGADVSKYASKEIEESFDDDVMPDGFEADDEAVADQKKHKHFWNKKDKITKEDMKNSENIVLDCDNVDYDTASNSIIATGNVNVHFVTQDTTVKAQKITFDRYNNTIKAEEDVVIIKNGQIIKGDYIFVDMNEENALIENPSTVTNTMEMHAKKGYVYGDRIVQENGSASVNTSYPVAFVSSMMGIQSGMMITPKYQSLESDMEAGKIKFKAKDVKITEKGDLTVIALKKASLKKNKFTLMKVPALKIYTNKNREFGETNIFEVGSYRGLGMYAGPGFVFELPNSVLKAMPILNFNHGIGVGALGRYTSANNTTQAGYGTANKTFVLRGKQKLDDNLFIQYAVNDYMDEWFLGKRRPKYGVDLNYDKAYGKVGFLLKNQNSTFTHRLQFGYYQDIAEDFYYKDLSTNNTGTFRFRYMAQADQSLYSYRNEEKQTAVNFDISSQLSAALYGTGETQVIGRIGPRLHLQYRRWMQDIGYFHSVYDDNTPMPVYDAYRYGKANAYIREYLRLNRYLTVAWFGSVNLSNDSHSDYLFQENSFYVAVGPDDVKFNLGYDFIRQNTFFSVQVMTDIKGVKAEYDRLEIKQDKKAKPSKDAELLTEEEQEMNAVFKNSNRAPVLQQAQVENLRTVEDVL